MRRYSASFDTGSVEERIADLRRKIDELMHEQVSPTLSRVGSRAQSLAHQMSDTTRREADHAMGLVRERPLATIAVAVGVGLLIARLLRR